MIPICNTIRFPLYLINIYTDDISNNDVFIVKCNGSHEYFSCGQECDNVCATLNKQNKTNFPIVNIQCNEQCYCEDGYARNGSNICIPIEECPGKFHLIYTDRHTVICVSVCVVSKDGRRHPSRPKKVS